MNGLVIRSCGSGLPLFPQFSGAWLTPASDNGRSDFFRHLSHNCFNGRAETQGARQCTWPSCQFPLFSDANVVWAGARFLGIRLAGVFPRILLLWIHT